MAETKNQKFCRLVNARLEKVLYTFSLIANLAGPNYKRSTKHVDEITFALRNEIDRLEGIFFADKTNVDEFDLLAVVDAMGGDPDRPPRSKYNAT